MEINELFLRLMLKRLGWTQTKLAEFFSCSVGGVNAWSVGRRPFPGWLLRWLTDVENVLDCMEEMEISHDWTIRGEHGFTISTTTSDIIFTQGLGCLYKMIVETRPKRKAKP